MYTVLSATNRPNSASDGIVSFIHDHISKVDTAEKILLSGVDMAALDNPTYAPEDIHPRLAEIRADLLLPAHTLIVVCPEYNGSFPGVIKLFIDAVSVIDYSGTFAGKRVALVGVSKGRSGNIRGVDQLGSILQFLGCHIWPQVLPMSLIHKQYDYHSQELDLPLQKELIRWLTQLMSS